MQLKLRITSTAIKSKILSNKARAAKNVRTHGIVGTYEQRPYESFLKKIYTGRPSFHYHFNTLVVSPISPSHVPEVHIPLKETAVDPPENAMIQVVASEVVAGLEA
ncbi:hypothetical protein KDA_27230 [Dictyobacter alpinus]|uniref:Uncharacterized protein n=1 Tax=Dictyobacter alpinus TaxID=2014873 RepID=A0A402B7D4_9CHLR|nr:hypothetical protein KDA_27230 [Dictyobacter alpinus]